MELERIVNQFDISRSTRFAFGEYFGGVIKSKNVHSLHEKNKTFLQKQEGF